VAVGATLGGAALMLLEQQRGEIAAWLTAGHFRAKLAALLFPSSRASFPCCWVRSGLGVLVTGLFERAPSPERFESPSRCSCSTRDGGSTSRSGISRHSPAAHRRRRSYGMPWPEGVLFVWRKRITRMAAILKGFCCALPTSRPLQHRLERPAPGVPPNNPEFLPLDNSVQPCARRELPVPPGHPGG